ncbi:hypothetical protein OH76DRAFT_425653 [Lentinus brumalis]|uniref:Uncharacterized protein n=1 Tax=Lentinus brumalis TaxID=2498619 RepID=A0A371DWF4_9APHY|nr:hypothetical protein OH76DRAFT_425653 [Polyporus brumalis]
MYVQRTAPATWVSCELAASTRSPRIPQVKTHGKGTYQDHTAPPSLPDGEGRTPDVRDLIESQRHVSLRMARYTTYPTYARSSGCPANLLSSSDSDAFSDSEDRRLLRFQEGEASSGRKRGGLRDFARPLLRDDLLLSDAGWESSPFRASVPLRVGEPSAFCAASVAAVMSGAFEVGRLG